MSTFRKDILNLKGEMKMFIGTNVIGGSAGCIPMSLEMHFFHKQCRSPVAVIRKDCNSIETPHEKFCPLKEKQEGK